MRLSEDERDQLNEMIRKGKSSAQRPTKARILLKADVSEAGEGWSDSRIMEALGTSATTVYRNRQQLIEEGFEAVLSRKQRTRSLVAPTLRLLENRVVELDIIDRARNSTIQRV